MADVMSVFALLAAAVLVGLFVGWVICASLPALLHGVLVLGVLLAWTVTMVWFLSEGSVPPFPPGEFATALLGASPVVIVSSIAALLARRFNVSRSGTLATAAIAAVASSPLCVWALFSTACFLGDVCF
jgi:hypothetical protein